MSGIVGGIGSIVGTQFQRPVEPVFSEAEFEALAILRRGLKDLRQDSVPNPNTGISKAAENLENRSFAKLKKAANLYYHTKTVSQAQDFRREFRLHAQEVVAVFADLRADRTGKFQDDWYKINGSKAESIQLLEKLKVALENYAQALNQRGLLSLFDTNEYTDRDSKISKGFCVLMQKAMQKYKDTGELIPLFEQQVPSVNVPAHPGGAPSASSGPAPAPSAPPIKIEKKEITEMETVEQLLGADTVAGYWAGAPHWLQMLQHNFSLKEVSYRDRNGDYCATPKHSSPAQNKLKAKDYKVLTSGYKRADVPSASDVQKVVELFRKWMADESTSSAIGDLSQKTWGFGAGYLDTCLHYLAYSRYLVDPVLCAKNQTYTGAVGAASVITAEASLLLSLPNYFGFLGLDGVNLTNIHQLMEPALGKGASDALYYGAKCVTSPARLLRLGSWLGSGIYSNFGSWMSPVMESQAQDVVPPSFMAKVIGSTSHLMAVPFDAFSQHPYLITTLATLTAVEAKWRPVTKTYRRVSDWKNGVDRTPAPAGDDKKDDKIKHYKWTQKNHWGADIDLDRPPLDKFLAFAAEYKRVMKGKPNEHLLYLTFAMALMSYVDSDEKTAYSVEKAFPDSGNSKKAIDHAGKYFNEYFKVIFASSGVVASSDSVVPLFAEHIHKLGASPAPYMGALACLNREELVNSQLLDVSRTMSEATEESMANVYYGYQSLHRLAKDRVEVIGKKLKDCPGDKKEEKKRLQLQLNTWIEIRNESKAGQKRIGSRFNIVARASSVKSYMDACQEIPKYFVGSKGRHLALEMARVRFDPTPLQVLKSEIVVSGDLLAANALVEEMLEKNEKKSKNYSCFQQPLALSDEKTYLIEMQSHLASLAESRERLTALADDYKELKTSNKPSSEKLKIAFDAIETLHGELLRLLRERSEHVGIVGSSSDKVQIEWADLELLALNPGGADASHITCVLELLESYVHYVYQQVVANPVKGGSLVRSEAINVLASVRSSIRDLVVNVERQGKSLASAQAADLELGKWADGQKSLKSLGGIELIGECLSEMSREKSPEIILDCLDIVGKIKQIPSNKSGGPERARTLDERWAAASSNKNNAGDDEEGIIFN